MPIPITPKAASEEAAPVEQMTQEELGPWNYLKLGFPYGPDRLTYYSEHAKRDVIVQFNDPVILRHAMEVHNSASTLKADNDRLKAVNADLLAALKECLSYFESLQTDPTDEEVSAMKRARAAIARANGGKS